MFLNGRVKTCTGRKENGTHKLTRYLNHLHQTKEDKMKKKKKSKINLANFECIKCCRIEREIETNSNNNNNYKKVCEKQILIRIQKPIYRNMVKRIAEFIKERKKN